MCYGKRDEDKVEEQPNIFIIDSESEEEEEIDETLRNNLSALRPNQQVAVCKTCFLPIVLVSDIREEIEEEGSTAILVYLDDCWTQHRVRKDPIKAWKNDVFCNGCYQNLTFYEPETPEGLRELQRDIEGIEQIEQYGTNSVYLALINVEKLWYGPASLFRANWENINGIGN